MIYEVRSCDLRPRTLAEATKRMADAYEYRRVHGEMLACWRTEIGPLNRIIQVWAYEDMAQREAVRKAVAAQGRWPPDIGQFIVSLRSEIVTPLDIVPMLPCGQEGPYFDYHSYVYPNGELQKIRDAWARAVPHRLTYGPISAIWTIEFGELNRLVHVVPYRSLNDYAEIRARVAESGRWPPSLYDVRQGGAGYELVSQESMMLVALPFLKCTA